MLSVYFHKRVLNLFLVLFFCCQSFGQNNHTISISTKEWYRDSARNIHYTDWKIFSSVVVDSIVSFHQQAVRTDRFGGDDSRKYIATGFFRTQKINDRWWVIDPSGHPFYVVAMNGVRLGKSPNNNKAFDEKFVTKEKWISSVADLFYNNGFNTCGSWSDIEEIIKYNQTAVHPIAYTTQLSLIPTFRKFLVEKNDARKKESDLSLILDDDFAFFCENEISKIKALSNDANLLGHFSDNELPFTRNELNNVLKEEFKNSPGYIQFKKWMTERNISETSITQDQKDEFIGFVTAKYYSTVSNALKKNDPNHLYIGSRLHAAAKNNKYIFKAALPFIDIMSINYYGYWDPQSKHILEWNEWMGKPFFITEFYTKAEDSGMPNITGAGWLVKNQTDRGIHYQNFCLKLLQAKNCVGWHWFRYQDNDPEDKTADPSNNDANKGIVTNKYQPYNELLKWMKQLNDNAFSLITFFDSFSK